MERYAMSLRVARLLSLLVLASATCVGACAGTPEDEADVEGADSAATAGAPRFAQHTFVMHEGIAPAYDFKAKMGRLSLVLGASDPVAGEVARQSAVGGPPIEVGALTLLKVIDATTGRATVVQKEMITVRANGDQLEIVSPEPGAFDRYLLTSGTYTLSAMKLPWGGGTAFNEIRLSVTASW
jgi:hypothetical protein